MFTGIWVYLMLMLGLSTEEFICFVLIFILSWILLGYIIIKFLKKKNIYIKGIYKFLLMCVLFFINFYNVENYVRISEKYYYFISRSDRNKENNMVINAFKEIYPNDNFYFLSDMTMEKYRNELHGELYSDKLKEIKSVDCIHVTKYGDEEIGNGSSIADYSFKQYENLFIQKERNDFLKGKIKNILGNKIKVHLGIDEKINLDKILENIKDKNSDKNFEAWYLIIPIFLDEGIREEDYKEKIEELKKYMSNEMKITISDNDYEIKFIQNGFFKDYNLVEKNIFPPFREDEDIKNILEKIKSKKEITEEEKLKLIEVFSDNIKLI